MLGRTKKIGPLRKPSAKDYHIVMESLASVGIEKLGTRYIHSLSGGQYQRALIARALASEPNILVLDEPTTGMDIVAEHGFLELIQRLKDKHRLTVIMVTHDLSVAAEVSDSLIIINGRDRSVSVGPPMEVLTNKRLTNLFHRPLQVVKSEGKMTFIVGMSDELTDPGGTARDDEDAR
jgi:ABC-type cobalamin/Fe3+-siderophores transport system ATPase subunit